MTQNIEDTPEHNVPEPESEAVKSDAKEPTTETKPAATHKRTRKTPPAPVVENSVSLPVVEVSAPAASAVVGDGDTDDVFLSRLVYKAYAKKSLSVHHLQRRLNELGYTAAYSDLDGWYGDLTHDAVAQFQIDKGLQATGLMDAETAQAIFEGDPNVTLVLA